MKTAMIDKNGTMQECNENINHIYEDWFKQLLTTPEAENEGQEQIEIQNEGIIKQIQNCAETTKQHNNTTMEELSKAIQRLKNNKAADRHGMKNEFIKYGGEELRETLLNLLNEILRSQEIPDRWKQMNIKAIYKNKGDRREMKNQRGIFITNIISKIFEKIISNRNEQCVRKYLSSFQCGSRKQRSIHGEHGLVVKSPDLKMLG